jgi:hypothetical protein
MSGIFRSRDIARLRAVDPVLQANCGTGMVVLLFLSSGRIIRPHLRPTLQGSSPEMSVEESRRESGRSTPQNLFLN